MSEKSILESIVIFTDGACSGNPGRGGWGAVIAYPQGKVLELGGRAEQTTNNQMEITAVIEALKKVQDDEVVVNLYTDSVYVIRGITQWIWAWKKRGWKTAEGLDVANQEHWERLLSLTQKRGKAKLHWHFARGHSGIPGNERCDEIAVGFTEGRWVDLYEGPLTQYPVAIYDLPSDTSLPEMKPKTEKKQAYSYLSVLGQEVLRHRDWASCERHVKGRSGAKFKKAMSSEDELRILKEWGLDPQRVKDSP